ncbi:cytochrome P450 [Decorospora gaudefroyi]|uniref:Cytochrome P450 n=1 Tax=Decorospora gaudefroyi TaxID=184978 RepID=A0A6A5KMN6_9PLEO|nr:cytochrome P450 [Decorospora gaudefroyi]
MILEHAPFCVLNSYIGVIISTCILISLYLLSNRYRYGLHRIPGPLLASFTDLWRLVQVWKGRPELTQIELHEQNGPIVRLGPNCISIADPDAIKTIYAHKRGYVKSDFYPVQQTVAKGQRLETLFSTTNDAFHAKLRRAVGNAYAMSSLIQFEPLVDSTITTFLAQLEQRFASRTDGDEGGVCDFGLWLQYFAFDVIGELTFSKRLGFVDKGMDVDGIIGDLERLLNYVAPVGQLPILDKIFVKNPLRLWISKLGLTNTTTPVAAFARARMAERSSETEEKSQAEGTKSRDFLSRFQEAHRKDPAFMTQQRVLAVTVANMFAGSDTTAITLRTIFYNLLLNPTLLQRLMNELESNDIFSETGLTTWSKVHDLPYLSAVIKEALRCHPAAGLSLERIVPPTGLAVCGHFIPGGTIVGCNAWVLHRNERVFGAQPELFRPERWIEATEEKKNEMNNLLFSFGAGTRSCIGKNISLLEMYKVVPVLLHKFEVAALARDQPVTMANTTQHQDHMTAPRHPIHAHDTKSKTPPQTKKLSDTAGPYHTILVPRCVCTHARALPE